MADRRRILVIPGDGIGREVVPLAAELLKREPRVEVQLEHAGYELWRQTGDAIPERVVAAALSADGVLFGCTGTPSPPPPGYESPILVLRHRLGLMVNIRYCRSVGGRPLDVVMLRDCSEGLYVERERHVEDGVIADYQVTRGATVRLARAAAEMARRRRGDVTIVHKANVLRHADGLFRQLSIETVEAAGVKWNEALSDAAGYHLVLDPGRYDVMMMTSHVGDILSDVGAAVVGSLGLVPSLSLGKGVPLAEPIHGSAPDLVGRGLADPVATILSMGLLLDHLGIRDFAAQLNEAVNGHLVSRKAGSPLRTAEIMDDIIRRLGQVDPAKVAGSA
ncbi:isocitrate/isopropylmalate family dehydrogenase [Sorangium sp. So ce281]|uniref:isocitrate/isopropylmalate family dehydrogenase n=1 Tax=unclassified Sorangium TaxID=2621164 RepID=UPI003F5FCE54